MELLLGAVLFPSMARTYAPMTSFLDFGNLQISRLMQSYT